MVGNLKEHYLFTILTKNFISSIKGYALNCKVYIKHYLESYVCSVLTYVLWWVRATIEEFYTVYNKLL